MRIGSPAFTFVLTMGAVNLFGDITYEGGGSISGPFMATLGASALAISITAGAVELLGCAGLRLSYRRSNELSRSVRTCAGPDGIGARPNPHLLGLHDCGRVLCRRPDEL